uniref:Uncharacterized protein n=1 Tax=Zea mays TaxID=4577 RepID=B6U9G5_MAIZE|nr:hypothetical protein [Zea mays]
METVVGDLMATELRLGLPGTVDDCSQHQQQTQLKVAAPPSNPTRGKKRPAGAALTVLLAGYLLLLVPELSPSSF